MKNDRLAMRTLNRQSTGWTFSKERTKCENDGEATGTELELCRVSRVSPQSSFKIRLQTHMNTGLSNSQPKQCTLYTFDIYEETIQSSLDYVCTKIVIRNTVKADAQN